MTENAEQSPSMEQQRGSGQEINRAGEWNEIQERIGPRFASSERRQRVRRADETIAPRPRLFHESPACWPQRERAGCTTHLVGKLS